MSDTDMNYSQRVRQEEVQGAILKLLDEKAPNNVRIKRIYEKLSEYKPDEIDNAIDELLDKGSLVLLVRKEKINNIKYPAIISEVEKRNSISLPSYPEDMYVQGEYQIGNNKVVRLLSGDIIEGEDINELIEALRDYIDDIDKTFDKRIRRETAKIYRQMIGIFGVFVSIFAVIVIATEKMLRFSPEVLANNPLDLLIKSAAIFLPVGLVIGGLVWLVIRSARE